MKKIEKLTKFFLLWILVFMICCTGSDYDRVLKREMNKGTRYDSLFLGINFNMERKDFYAHCWRLNKQEVIRQGPSNLSVQYQIDSALMKHPAYMWFYPEFKDNKINRMPIDFSYINWAPWLPEMSTDSLLSDTKRLMEKWYGNGFFLVENKDKSKHVWVKIDGNRRIMIYPKTISTVQVDLADMTNRTKKLEENDADEVAN